MDTCAVLWFVNNLFEKTHTVDGEEGDVNEGADMIFHQVLPT